MIKALINGKLSREQENMEDVLTSNVFGLLSYLPPSQALIPFLRKCIPFSTEATPKTDWLPDDSEIFYNFWPKWTHYDGRICEPDVVLKIDQQGEPKSLVCIEAKYRSGKSSTDGGEEATPEETSRDQLVREWENLRTEAKRDGRKAILIYLTADFGMPISSMRESLRFKSDNYLKHSLYWLSWRHLKYALNPKSHIEQDLIALTDRMDFFLFEGVRGIPKSMIDWSYSRRSKDGVAPQTNGEKTYEGKS
jgi:hypothetical protein